MQSWGTQSRFSVRDTGLEPSKSGVIGLLCAAIGRPRSEPLHDLVSLAMGVRVDREGRMARDFQTALDVVRADGSGIKDCEPSERFYLADAAFLVGLEGDPELLKQLETGLRQPKWPLSLGRKAFTPGTPILGPGQAMHEGALRDVLRRAPWQRRRRGEIPPERLRYILDVSYGEGEPRQDVPLSFATRQFTIRHVRTEFLPVPEQILDPETDDVPQSVDGESPEPPGAE
jgi:CRISPR system Cascade subunit CasD